MKTLVPVFVVAHLVAVGLASGQAKDSWVGKRVFTKPGTVLRGGDQDVDDDGTSRVYRVEQINGERLWLRDELSGVAGWVQDQQVIPLEKAIEHYSALILKLPQASNFCSRAIAWFENGDNDMAISDFNEAIRLRPGESFYWMDRGNAWRAKREYDKAIADLDEAIRLDPKYAGAYNIRGAVWRAKEEYEKALTDLNEAIRLDPKYANAYLNRGNVWSEKEEHDKAIADYNEVIRLHPKYAYAYNNRGNAWMDKEDYNKALADFNEAIRLDPKLILAYGSRAWLWATCPDEKYRDGKKAVESATRACELGEWEDADELGTLAAAYAEAGDFEKAVEWQEKANHDQTDAEAKKNGEDRLKLYKDKKPYRVLE